MSDISKIEVSVENAEKLYTYAYAVVTSGVLSRGAVDERYVMKHGRKFVNAKDEEAFIIVRPNNDNLYSNCWTQLKNTPYVLELPEVENRYLLANFLNTKTDIPFAVGSKNHKTAGKYILLYRDDPVPAGYEDYEVVRSEDSRNFLLIRLEAFDANDYATANAIQDEIIFKAVYPEKLENRGEKIKTLSTIFIENMNLEEFYQEYVSAFEDSKIEEDYIKLVEAFGIDTKTGDFSGVSADARKVLEEGKKIAYEKITRFETKSTGYSNGWSYNVDNGFYGDNYILRARVAYFGYGANLAEDSIYPSYEKNLPSNKPYKIHFEKDKVPYAEFFWSITLYGEPSQFLTDNEIDRYVINSHMLKDLQKNQDGSIDILIQQERPSDPALLPNWLPAPKDEDEFSLTMRIYGPSKEQLKGVWEGPKVVEN